MAERTLPPTRRISDTATLAYPSISPIDAYGVNIDRPLAYFESTCARETSNAVAGIPTLYAKATVTSGTSGTRSAAAGYFETHLAGTSIGRSCGLASYVYLDNAFVAHSDSGGLGSPGVITPLTTSIQCLAGSTVTLDTMLVIGLNCQYFQQGTGVPTYLFFARLNCSTAITALFYTDNHHSAGYVTATKTTPCGSIPLIWIHGYGPAQDAPLYVNLYEA